MTELNVRKIRVVVEETHHVLDHADNGGPLRKVAACAVFRNPYANRGYVHDLSEIVEASQSLGTRLGKLCAETLSDSVDSYGKAGIAGTAGEQEHVHAALTSVFGNAFRESIGGAEAWITSTKKIGAPGTSIDVPLAFKDELWVRSHYDTITANVPDAPLPDELVVIAAVANRGRINARVGGLTKGEVLGRKETAE